MNAIGYMLLLAFLIGCHASVLANNHYLVDLIVFSPSQDNWLEEEQFQADLPDRWQWVNEYFHATSLSNTSAISSSTAAMQLRQTPLTSAHYLDQHPGLITHLTAIHTEETPSLLEKPLEILQHSKNYQVHYRASFVHHFGALNKAQPYWLASSKNIQPLPQIMGWITLYRGRFLHIKTDLLLTQNQWQKIAFDSSGSSTWPSASYLNEHNSSNRSSDDKNDNSNKAPKTAAEKVLVARQIAVTQQQKLNTEDLFYLDHPGVGILVTLKAIKP